MDATGYALQKVVHNKAIVREVDELRQRELWQWVWIGLILVLVLLVSVWLDVGILWHGGYRMEDLQRQRAFEEQRTRVLQVEIERLSSPRLIEAYATTRLHMIAPGPDDAIVIPRAIAPQRPPSSVVARR